MFTFRANSYRRRGLLRKLRFEECESRRLLSAADGEFCVPSSSAERLGAVATAFLSYESAHRYFPNSAIESEDGHPLLSWRVALLPYIGQMELYEQFALDEAWDTPSNLALVDQMPELYVSPSQQTSPGETVFQVFTGERTAFPGSIPRSRCDAPGGCGLRIGEIEDGLSNSTLVVEAAADQAVPWTQPDDLVYDQANPLLGLPIDGLRFALATGEVIETEASISPTLWNRLVTVSDGEFVDVADVARPLDPARSLRYLSLAILNHESATSRFPVHARYSDDGQPLLSWRVSILPYIDQTNLYNEFHHDEPWDSPHNIRLVPKMPRVFSSGALVDGMTNYLALVGQGTIFPLPTEATNRGIKLRQVEDGISETLLLVEANADHAVEWTKPLDINFDPTDPLTGLGGDNGFHVAMADGRVQWLPSDADADLFRSAALIDDRVALRSDRIKGDVDFDGVVDASDATIVLRNLFGASSLSYGWENGDLNGDRVVDGSDLNIWMENRFQVDPAPRDREPLHARPPHAANEIGRRALEFDHGQKVVAGDPTADQVDEYFELFSRRSDNLRRRRFR